MCLHLCTYVLQNSEGDNETEKEILKKWEIESNGISGLGKSMQGLNRERTGASWRRQEYGGWGQTKERRRTHMH